MTSFTVFGKMSELILFLTTSATAIHPFRPSLSASLAINFATSTVYDNWNNEFISRILLQVGWIILFALLLKKLYMEALKKSMLNGG